MDGRLMGEGPRKHRILVAGGGSIGERHVRCFLATGRARVGVCDVHPGLLRALAERYPLEATFQRYEEALDGAWDAVVIATPAHLHVPQAAAAAERGTALFIEKPLGTTLQGVDALLEVARERGLVANVAYVYRAHPAIAVMKAMVESGTLGAVHQVVARGGQHFPTFRPAYREIYYADRATGGGAIQDALTHWFNAVQHLAGRFDSIFADYAHQSLEGVSVEDTVNAVARLNAGAVLAGFTLNQFNAPNESVIEVHGEEGSARIEAHAHRLGTWMRGESDWSVGPALLHERDELFILQARSFLDALGGRAPVLCTLEEAAHTLRVNLAALRSGEEGRMVRIHELDATFDPGRLC
jgi:predicted dehydrogenase